MNIHMQIKLIRRLQSDLKKEENKHLSDGNSLAAADCEEQRNGLDSVLKTLQAAQAMSSCIAALSAIELKEPQ